MFQLTTLICYSLLLLCRLHLFLLLVHCLYEMCFEYYEVWVNTDLL
jgi:hypothetical protein